MIGFLFSSVRIAVNINFFIERGVDKYATLGLLWGYCNIANTMIRYKYTVDKLIADGGNVCGKSKTKSKE